MVEKPPLPAALAAQGSPAPRGRAPEWELAQAVAREVRLDARVRVAAVFLGRVRGGVRMPGGVGWGRVGTPKKGVERKLCLQGSHP